LVSKLIKEKKLIKLDGEKNTSQVNMEDGKDMRTYVEIGDADERAAVFGNMDSHLDLIRRATGTEIYQRDDNLILKSGNLSLAKEILEELIEMVRRGEKLNEQKVHYVIMLKENGKSYIESDIGGRVICFTKQGKPIKAKTLGQKNYLKSIQNRDLVFAIGPAGTGKTYLAVAAAAACFKKKEVKRIVLTRPAVEAGERLGFLPGDLQEKVDPYLRPLYDALYEILGKDTTARLKEKDTIEIAPLAYMRGRTLSDSFIILDEAQNCTSEQMKMFLTRMGEGSKVVVTGDVTQIDLPDGKKSGLIDAQRILKGIEGIDFCYLKAPDIVRNPMVRKIVAAYEEYNKKVKEKEES
jgi:phosphate starvation-inducible PhoH-like protein